MKSVFVLQHSHELDDGSDEVKFIGVYSTRANAEAVVERLVRARGFSDSRDGFHIDAYELDQDHWVEGYTTVASV